MSLLLNTQICRHSLTLMTLRLSLALYRRHYEFEVGKEQIRTANIHSAIVVINQNLWLGVAAKMSFAPSDYYT